MYLQERPFESPVLNSHLHDVTLPKTRIVLVEVPKLPTQLPQHTIQMVEEVFLVPPHPDTAEILPE